MAAIEIFKNESFGEVRVIGTSEQPLFCLLDVCKILCLDSSQVMKRLDDGVVTIHPTPDSLGRMRDTNFVNEDGLYDTILDSRKPEAKAFRKWITSEVLPSIRKTGSYTVQKSELSRKELAMMVIQAEEEKERLALDNKRLEEEKQAIIVQKDAQIKQLEEQSEYARIILKNPGLMLVSQIAADYGMSAIKFNALLRGFEVQKKVRNQWILRQKYADKGYTGSSTHNFKHRDGTEDIAITTEWTQTGRLFLYRFLKDRGILPTMETFRQQNAAVQVSPENAN